MNLLGLSTQEISDALNANSIVVCVVGLGRIGLLTAAVFANAGFNVLGIDKDERVVLDTNAGLCRFVDEPGLACLVKEAVDSKNLVAGSDFSYVPKADLIIVCVSTPIGERNVPDCSCMLEASSRIASHLRRGAIVVIESSVSPGTVEDAIVPLIERRSGLKVMIDFGVCSCPERASPGEVVKIMGSVTRIIGGMDLRSTEIVAAVYKYVLKVQVIIVSNPKTANAVKLTENVFRDVNIALMNEFAILYQKLGIDVIEVIEACKTKWNFLPHYPSLGVGGPCLPTNPYYLLEAAKKAGYVPSLVKLAREVNEKMPEYVASLVVESLSKLGKNVDKSKIALLGISYKPRIHDAQMSPSKELLRILATLGAYVSIYDPLFRDEDILGVKVAQNLDQTISGADCIIIGTADEEFQKLDLLRALQLCNSPAAIVDTQHVILPSEAKEKGFMYVGIGRS